VTIINAARVDPKPLIDTLRVKRSAQPAESLRMLAESTVIIAM
jgi:hypothetical protein